LTGVGNILWSMISQYGILGVFLVSLLGNAIPYSTIPYLIFIIIYSGTVQDPMTNLLITLAGGLGAAIGKVIVYYFGVGIRKLIPEDMKKNMEVFIKISRQSVFLAVFLFAALPLPDDILYVPLGAMRYDLVKFFIALLAGKIVITGTAVYFGYTVSWLIGNGEKVPWYIVVPVLIIISLLLTYIVAKIDWAKAVKITEEKGLWSGVKYVLEQTIKALVDLFLWPYRKIKAR